MGLSDDVEALRQTRLFANIEPAKLKLLAFTSERLEFFEEDVLFRQGDSGDAAYILLDGSAEVVVDTPKGPLTVATLDKNDIVGEIAILCDVPRTATVVAKTDMVTLKISKDGFFNIVAQFPQVAIEIMSELATRLNATTQRASALTARVRELEQAAS